MSCNPCRSISISNLFSNTFVPLFLYIQYNSKGKADAFEDFTEVSRLSGMMRVVFSTPTPG